MDMLQRQFPRVKSPFLRKKSFAGKDFFPANIRQIILRFFILFPCPCSLWYDAEGGGGGGGVGWGGGGDKGESSDNSRSRVMTYVIPVITPRRFIFVLALLLRGVN